MGWPRPRSVARESVAKSSASRSPESSCKRSTAERLGFLQRHDSGDTTEPRYAARWRAMTGPPAHLRWDQHYWNRPGVDPPPGVLGVPVRGEIVPAGQYRLEVT
jgi:hypothetical protein